MKLVFSLLFVLASAGAFAQTTVPAKEAAKHIGEKVTICEKVYGGKFFANSGITLLNMGGEHPNELFTVVIKGDDRKKFAKAPEEDFANKTICVTGEVIDYKGKPEIVVNDPEQIKVSQ